MENNKPRAVKIFGLGGRGIYFLNHLIKFGPPGLQYVAADSDFKALEVSLAPVKIPIGRLVVRGNGCASSGALGIKCVEENAPELVEALGGADLVFLVASLGDGVGSGGLPLVAQNLAKSVNSPYVVALVFTPFEWEVNRSRYPRRALPELRKSANGLIVVDMAKLMAEFPDEPFDAFTRDSHDLALRVVASYLSQLEKTGEGVLDRAEAAAAVARAGQNFVFYRPGLGGRKFWGSPYPIYFNDGRPGPDDGRNGSPTDWRKE